MVLTVVGLEEILQMNTDATKSLDLVIKICMDRGRFNINKIYLFTLQVTSMHCVLGAHYINMKHFKVKNFIKRYLFIFFI